MGQNPKIETVRKKGIFELKPKIDPSSRMTPVIIQTR